MMTKRSASKPRLLRALLGMVVVVPTLIVAPRATHAAVPGTPGDVIYTKYTEAGEFLYRINPSSPGDGRGTLITSGTIGSLSPDGESIVFEGVNVADANGQNARLVVQGEMPAW